MIFIKKPRPTFIFSNGSKMEVSKNIKKQFSSSNPLPKIPAIFGKRGNSKFERLVDDYGPPEYDSRNGKAQINTWGVAVFPTGQQFVVDAKTGDVLEKTEKVRYIGMSKGLHFYIHEDNDLLIGDHAKPSFPRMPA